jgi:uncharacterized protein YggT (Ycf19 family)
MAQPERKYRPEDSAPEPAVPLERVPPGDRVRPVHEAHLRPIRTQRRPLTRLVNAVDYLFFILYGLFAIRFVLALLNASQEAPFTRLIHTLTQPFYAPFERIVSRPAVDGGYLDFPLVIAVLGYVLLHVAVRGLIRVVQGRPATR